MVMGDMEMSTDLVVIGAGPGGYTAAFRAAELGLDVCLIDPRPGPGGACLFDGCIGSRTLLHGLRLIHDAQQATKMGLHFAAPAINLQAMRKWQEEGIARRAENLFALSQKLGILLIQGRAEFTASDAVRLEGGDISRMRFKHCIIATGSLPAPLPEVAMAGDSRMLHPAAALRLPDIPESLLVIGGNYIGLEIGTIYSTLGSRVTIITDSSHLLSGVDPDLVSPLANSLADLFSAIHLQTTVVEMTDNAGRIEATFTQAGDTFTGLFNRVVVAAGRKPNSSGLGLDNTAVSIDSNGFIQTDEQQRTTDGQIFAVGDVTGGIQLSHTAMYEGRIAAEVIAGQNSAFDARAIPASISTSPPISWCGLTEEEALRDKIPHAVSKIDWSIAADDRRCGEGLTKLVIEPQTGRILGVGITGSGAEEMIAGATLAIEMGCLAEDLALTIHPHPGRTETLQQAARQYLEDRTNDSTGRKS